MKSHILHILFIYLIKQKHHRLAFKSKSCICIPKNAAVQKDLRHVLLPLHTKSLRILCRAQVCVLLLCPASREDLGLCYKPFTVCCSSKPRYCASKHGSFWNTVGISKLQSEIKSHAQKKPEYMSLQSCFTAVFS